MTFLTRDEAAVGLLGTWMIGPDQITVPVRIGTVVRDFGRNFIWSGPWSGVIWSDILVRSVVRTYLVRNFGPVRGPN